METEHLRADNRGTALQGEDVAHKGVLLTLAQDHIGNLDHWVLLWFGEDAWEETKEGLVMAKAENVFWWLHSGLEALIMVNLLSEFFS